VVRADGVVSAGAGPKPAPVASIASRPAGAAAPRPWFILRGGDGGYFEKGHGPSPENEKATNPQPSCDWMIGGR
jgi:hypothetical protein